MNKHGSEVVLRICAPLIIVSALITTQAAAQGLRNVPQRFVEIQPAGLLLGIGSGQIEFAVGRNTSISVGGVAVYSEQDGVQIRGGGGGIGVRHYPASGELRGTVVAARVDVVSLEASSPWTRRSRLYLGVAGFVGHRFLANSGFFFEPRIGYEYFVGPRPLIPRSQQLQDDLGLIIGVAVGHSW